MFPSKVILTQHISLPSSGLNKLVVDGFDEIYNPKQTFEELLAEILAFIQNKVIKSPFFFLETDSDYGLIPQQVDIKILNLDKLHLSSVIKSKGNNLHFDLTIEFSEVQLVGYMENKLMIIHKDADIWNEFVDIIYLHTEAGFSIKKMKLME